MLHSRQVPKILVVEDDPPVQRAIARVLEREGHDMRLIDRGGEFFDAIQSFGPDLVLLDIRLPEADGRTLLTELRARPGTRRLPVILMSALGSEADRAIGLDLGADDYLSKPFGPLELAARIRACLRRQESPIAVTLAHGPLVIDAQNRTARLGRKALELQPREFDVLFLLAKNPHRLLTREVLHESTSPTGAETSSRSLDTHIKNLRKKLGTLGRWIVTVPKMGYRFDPDEK